MEHEFILSQSDGRPMYLQIMEQIKLRISVGDWPEGHKLPSIRELAVASRVSVITVKRAYQDLENEDVIVTQQGKGSFVASLNNLGSRLKDEEMEEHLKHAIDIARSQGMTPADLVERLQTLLQGKKK